MLQDQGLDLRVVSEKLLQEIPMKRSKRIDFSASKRVVQVR